MRSPVVTVRVNTTLPSDVVLKLYTHNQKKLGGYSEIYALMLKYSAINVID